MDGEPVVSGLRGPGIVAGFVEPDGRLGVVGTTGEEDQDGKPAHAGNHDTESVRR